MDGKQAVIFFFFLHQRAKKGGKEDRDTLGKVFVCVLSREPNRIASVLTYTVPYRPLP